MASPSKRRETDLMKLMMAEYEVELAENNRMGDFFVKFCGPVDTPYEGGVWKVHVTLPEAYPYKSPSIGFVNRIYHPNVDEMSGSVCLDVINQTWSPMFDLVNIFEVFLPQLLTYPNPSDPLNGEAAALEMREPEKYIAKVRDYVQRYAHPSLFASCSQKELEEDSDNESEWSDLEDNETSCSEISGGKQVGVTGSSVVESGIFV
ncbi:hypothetical protein GpartN1_g4796.t1 [Galdieria partita]|uniref:UBC core domain-containing protein n=1 Tax=Galdieria partita TaxID=83374 RepID=A0A9C7PSQ1_9RHOD|nr:hypothetical protein GpartN1_g1829.t1 [Galdieria partita]GJQ13005.1 hypothetical protein GpartN1_g4796.t1 [Galdieria partita]